MICLAPRYLDFTATRPCFVAQMHLDAFGPCGGVMEPHHEPFVSQGGDDRDVIPACAVHHRMRHDEHAALTAFVIEYATELKHENIGAYLLFIEQSNGEIPAPARTSRASVRKNREPYEPYKKPW